MNKLSILALAAAVGAAGVGAADAAFAKPKRPAPQKYSCKTSKGAFRDNFNTKLKDEVTGKIVPVGQFSSNGFVKQLTMYGTQQNIGRTGAGSSKIVNLTILGVDDPRSVTLPKTYSAGQDGVLTTGTFTITTFKYSRFKIPGLPGGGTLKTTVNAWVPDEDGTVPFSITFTKYDAVTNRLTGKFEGEMLPGDSNDTKNQKSIKVTKGAFSVDCAFNGF